jgi:hypothetical protein
MKNGVCHSLPIRGLPGEFDRKTIAYLVGFAGQMSEIIEKTGHFSITYLKQSNQKIKFNELLQ